MSRSVNEEQHQAAIEALVQVGSPAVPLLLLSRCVITIQPYVVMSSPFLDEIHDPRAIEPMVDLLLDESPSSEDKLKEILISFGPIALEPLAKAFGSTSSIDIQKGLLLYSLIFISDLDEPTAITYFLLKEDFDQLSQMGEPATKSAGSEAIPT